jgi:hypothetical protein
MMHITCGITIAALLYPMYNGAIPLAGVPFSQELMRTAGDMQSREAPYASLVILTFLTFLLVGSKLLPGHPHTGTELKDKTRKVYMCNIFRRCPLQSVESHCVRRLRRHSRRALPTAVPRNGDAALRQRQRAPRPKHCAHSV